MPAQLLCSPDSVKPLIRQLLDVVPLFREQRHLEKKKNLVYVMLYDMLFGQHDIIGGGSVKKALLKYKVSLNAALARLKIKHKVVNDADLLPAPARQPAAIPRYVRVNTLKIDIDTAMATLSKDFSITVDEHVPSLIVLPANVDLHAHPLVSDGSLVLQDKAACFSALALLAPRDGRTVHVEGDIIDACAAPGNKTTQLAALLGKQTPHHIFAFDKSRTRADTLQQFVSRCGAATGVIEVRNEDFLAVDLADPKFNRVRYVLVDPSCSGSGITSRLDSLLQFEEEHAIEEKGDGSLIVEGTTQYDRLAALAKLQQALVLHAMSFPSVERVVYSTCSIHEQENEGVVAAVLAAQQAFELDPDVLPAWPRRGVGSPSGLPDACAKCCIRTDPHVDRTIGFFVACFKRKHETETANDTPSRKRKREGPPREAENALGSDATTRSQKKKKKKNKKRKKRKLSSASTKKAHNNGRDV